MLWTITLALAITVACRSTNIPNIKFYAEIPFVDCPEAVYVESLTKKRGVIGCEDWKKMRPFMIMVDPEGKKDIFMQWAEACRYATLNQEECNAKQKSVKEIIDIIDGITEKVMGGLPK